MIVQGFYDKTFIICLQKGIVLNMANRIKVKNVDSAFDKWLQVVKKDFKRNYILYLLFLPVIVHYAIFSYAPMYGVIIAFKRFTPGLGIWGSQWVGFKYFIDFFNSYYFVRIVRNTVLINIYELLFAFPAPIILALVLNEVRHQKFKRIVQSVSYLPHFISTVVICGMIRDFFSYDGIISYIVTVLGGEAKPFLSEPQLFRTIYVSTGIWQSVGWGSIIYLAAISKVDLELYEAAAIDGIGRIKQMFYITIPCIMPTIIILLILELGRIMSVGFQKVYLLYNPRTYETADVIATFVYRRGLLENNYSYGTAVSLFNSFVNFLLVISANKISRKVTDYSLW